MDREAIHKLATLYGSPADDRVRNINLRCPLAPVTHASGENVNPALAIKVEPGGTSPAYCRSCGAGGTTLSIFEEANLRVGGFDEVVRYIRDTDRGGLAGALARLRIRDEPKSAGRDPLAVDWTAYAARCARFVPRYLIERRGVVARDIQRWQIGYDPELMRATFPVRNEKQKVVGVSRRTVVDAEPKFLDTPGPWKSTVFYGEHLLDVTREHAYLVEGVMGTVYADRILPNVLGMLGAQAHIDGERLAKLRRWCKSVTLIFDSDEAGHAAVHGWTDKRGKRHAGLRETLRPFFVVKVATLPPKCDPADVHPDVLRAAVDGARYLF